MNLIRPELVRELHAQYIAAGAQIIETNSFGGNRLRLAEYGLDQQMTQINRRAAELAVESRQSINHEVLVAGSIGPLGQLIAPLGSISQANAEEIYREQIDALISGGVELLILETYTSLAELELAVRVARQIAPHLPVIAAMSFDQATPEAAQAMVQAMRPWPLAALGANCGSGPEQAIQIVGQLVEAGAAVVIAFPNAGLPQRLAGRLHYSGRPEYFANAARQLIAAGARLVGGCCGTGPVHTAAMRQALEERRGSNRGGTSQLQSASLSSTPPTNTAAASSTLPPRGEESMVSGGIYGGSRLAAQLQGDRAVFSVELRPPRGINPKRMLQRARQMRQAGVEFANLTDSAMARLRMGVLGSAALVQQQTELEAIAHYTT
ncbi:MAG: homocysteine S-methyltransferase family protein, partial [Candidatus Dormibacteraceae bacterium]